MTDTRHVLFDGPLRPPYDTMSALCPRCRRLVSPDAPCVVDGATPLSTHDPAQRERLIEVMWGTPAERTALQAAQLPAGPQRLTAGLLGGGLTMMAMLSVEVEFVLAVAAASFSAVACGALRGARRRVLVPADATALPALPVVGRGRIEGAPPLTAPGSGVRCAAWAIELRHEGSWGARTTLRAGASGGFDVRLDGGECVRIPAGALWIDGPLSQVDDEDGSVADLLRALDPRAASSDWALFPYNVIREATIAPTGVVEVRGQVASRPLQDVAGLTYREAAPSVLVPVGLPVLRRASP